MASTVKTTDDTDIYQVDVSLPSADLVYGLINHDNPPGDGESVLTPELAVLGVPLPNQTEFDRNTQISITATAKLTELEDYQGTATLAYDRINIGNYLKNVSPVVVDDPEAVTMRDIWPTIQAEFNLGLVTTEIVDDTLNWDTVNGQLLKVTPTCLAWMGSVRILMKSKIPSLDDIVAVKGLNGLTFQGIGTKASGEVYSYGRDTTNYSDYMQNLPTGTTITDVVVADALSEMTGDRWVLDDVPAAYNLYNATVTFNGELGEEIPARAGFQYGIEIALDGNFCSAVGGPLIFYYNTDDAPAFLKGRTAFDQRT